MIALLLCAGLGTRLRPLTDTLPKALIPVAGKPLLAHQIERLHQAGCTHLIINIHHLADQIIQYLADHHFPLTITLSDERPQLLDTGGAIRKAAHLLPPGNEPLLVHNVDILHNAPLAPFYATHHPQHDATLLTSPRPTTRLLLADAAGHLRAWTNTQTGALLPPDADTNTLRPHAFAGIHVISRTAIQSMASWPERFSIIDFYLQRCRTHTIRLQNLPTLRLLDIGKPQTLKQAEDFIKETGA